MCWSFLPWAVISATISRGEEAVPVPVVGSTPCPSVRTKESVIAGITSSFLSSSLLVLNNISELLGLDAFQLSEVLTQRSMFLRGEEISSPLTVEQVSMLPTVPHFAQWQCLPMEVGSP